MPTLPSFIPLRTFRIVAVNEQRREIQKIIRSNSIAHALQLALSELSGAWRVTSIADVTA